MRLPHRLQGQKVKSQGRGAGAYCGGHLAAQLVIGWDVNPSESTGNYSATSNNMKLVHWPLMGGLLHLVQRGGDWAGPQPAQAPPRCTKCNSLPVNGQCTH